PRLVTSRFRTSINCTLYRRTASSTCPPPSIRGLAPPPYRSMMTGPPSAPELFGANWSCHTDPLLSRMRSAGRNPVEFTCWIDCQAALAEVPELESAPLEEST